MNFRNKKVLVVGLGVSGQAAVRFFLARGARVAVTDQKGEEELREVLEKLSSSRSLECHFGPPADALFADRDLIVVSPGVPSTLPGLRRARRRRIPILGEFGIAAGLVRGPMIAVTGTNGKSTTVTLIAKILEGEGFRTALAGNIGKPLLEVVMENKRWDWVVAEVSSYQLETVRRFRPRVAALLNITEDHLDRYRNLRDYARAKFRIFEEQGPRDLLIYNRDDPMVRRGVRRARSKKVGFSAGADLRGGTILFGNEEYPLDRVKLVGLHNVENMMAAIVATRFAGVSPATIRKGLESFEGLPHRVEWVSEHRGVRYYDDSKGTNVDAVVKSLAGFPDRRVILIAGGRDKGGSYEPLRRMAERKAKLLILIGEARDRIGTALEGVASTIKVEGLEEAVPLAAGRAETGDVVLLSPACASFDQFRDYKERGDLFQDLVKRL